MKTFYKQIIADIVQYFDLKKKSSSELVYIPSVGDGDEIYMNPKRNLDVVKK